MIGVITQRLRWYLSRDFMLQRLGQKVEILKLKQGRENCGPINSLVPPAAVLAVALCMSRRPLIEYTKLYLDHNNAQHSSLLSTI